MANVTASLEGVHSAVDKLLAAADAAATVWTVPRAPGKWSPSQVAELVARIMEESAHVAADIFRMMVLKRILRRK